MREGFVHASGGGVFYRIANPNAPGVPLLVVHGGPGIPHDYLEPLEALDGERPVIFYDQLGCGNSERPSDLSYCNLQFFVDELDTVRRALCPDRVHILGQSWGSMLAVEYLLEKRPTGVGSLILSGPCLNARRFVADQRAHLENMPDAVRNTILEAEASGNFTAPEYQEATTAFYRKHVCCLDPWPECMNRAVEKMNQEVYVRMWGPSEFTMTGSLKDYDRTADLWRITVPVLFTCGRLDEATPETTAGYQSRLPGSEIRIFENASHEHHLEQPEAYLHAVRDFLSRAEHG